MGKLEELSKNLGGKIRSQETMNMNFRTKSFQRLVANYRGYKIQIDEFGDLLLIGIKTDSDLAFSVNNIDRIFQFNKMLPIKNSPFIVYASNADDKRLSKTQSSFFLQDLFRQLLDIRLSNEETIFVYNNFIYYSLLSNRNLMPIIDGIIHLLSSHPLVFKKIKRPTNLVETKLPNNLKKLLPMINKWGVTDDFERQQLGEKMNQEEKIQLLTMVGPLMPEINEYLDRFENERLPEEAIRLGALAELVSEIS